MANIEPKVKNGTTASVVASGLVSWFVTYAGDHVTAIHDLVGGSGGAVVVGLAVGATAGAITFCVGYLTRHAPRELVKDVEAEMPKAE